jgi:hypothetical protein
MKSLQQRGEKMPIGPIGEFKIESETEADYYLRNVLAQQKYRSMDEVHSRARKIKDSRLKVYFINKGNEILKAYGIE